MTCKERECYATRFQLAASVTLTLFLLLSRGNLADKYRSDTQVHSKLAEALIALKKVHREFRVLRVGDYRYYGDF